MRGSIGRTPPFCINHNLAGRNRPSSMRNCVRARKIGIDGRLGRKTTQNADNSRFFSGKRAKPNGGFNGRIPKH